MRDYTNVQAVLNEMNLAAEYGAPMKAADDLARYARIIDAVKPRVIVETGFGLGGSSRWFSTHVEQVFSVEANMEVLDSLTAAPENVTIYAGSSIDPELFATLAKDIGDRAPVVVSLDSAHHYGHVAAELAMYAPLVTPGSYIVVEDTFRFYCPDINPEEGNALLACKDFVAAHDDFELDTTLQALTSFTLNPNGWIRRTTKG